MEDLILWYDGIDIFADSQSFAFFIFRFWIQYLEKFKIFWNVFFV